jgi:glycerol-3-phosphate dehydrogenase subunit B
MSSANGVEVDLAVIGGGLAGLATTAFATKRGLKTVQVSSTAGEMLFASGLLDLLGIHPLAQQKVWQDPWAGIAALIRDNPEHPYARVGLENIRQAWHEFLGFLQEAGLSYTGWPEVNAEVVTCAGTRKVTYRVPATMWPGVTGFQEKLPTLIVDFDGMKDFSGRQLVSTFGPNWPGLRSQRVVFPREAPGKDRHNVFMAESLGFPDVRQALAAAIRPVLKEAELVGVPAILGLQGPETVAADLEEQIGVPLFEIPTLPTSVPGLRLKETMEQELLRRGATLVRGGRAVAVNSEGRRCVEVLVESGSSKESLKASGMVLATGRFLGGGLAADLNGIWETLLGLPVHQPATRNEWHRSEFLDPRGHPVNRAGLEVDSFFRPLGENGHCAFENLFAAGSVLAHQDWMRMKCGAGIAIATAYRAVQSFIECS